KGRATLTPRCPARVPQRQPGRMAADISKHLDRAKRFLEKNRVEDAIEAYLAVLDESPAHAEATQALGDLYTRLNQPDRAAVYYGLFFVARFHEQVEKQAVIDGGAVRLIQPRVQVSQRLRRLRVRGALVQHGQIRLDRVFHAVLLEESLGAI